MLRFMERLYWKLGIHTAPVGTACYEVHSRVRRLVPHKEKKKVSAFALHMQEDPNSTMAIRITGGIGDHLITARYIRDLLAAAGDFTFDIYSSRPEIAEWVFTGFPQLQMCYNDYLEWVPNFSSYPLAMWVNHFVVLYADRADWHLVFKYNRKLAKICEAIERSRAKIDHHIIRHPLSDGFLAQEIVIQDMNRYNFTHMMSTQFASFCELTRY